MNDISIQIGALLWIAAISSSPEQMQVSAFLPVG
jgi:hypothetical protein